MLRQKIYDCRGNSAATWKIIIEIPPNNKDTNKNYLINKREIENKFNDLFVNVGERIFLTSQTDLSFTNQNCFVPQEDIKSIIMPTSLRYYK